ncbi:SusD family protein [compost metagenome]
MNASKQLYDLYPATDIRRSVIFGASISAENLANNNFPIRKYTGSTDGPTINDVKLFRSSDLKLIIAECKARNNNLAGAAVDVQELRLIRVLSPVPAIPNYANLNAALTDILLERRKEFAFEGHRYLDLKRIGAEINVGISRLADDAFTFNAPTSLAAGDYRFTMPIPTSEISANPTIVQNPNY